MKHSAWIYVIQYTHAQDMLLATPLHPPSPPILAPFLLPLCFPSLPPPPRRNDLPVATCAENRKLAGF